MHKESNNQPLLTFQKLEEHESISGFGYSTKEWNYLWNILLPCKLQNLKFIGKISTLCLNG